MKNPLVENGKILSSYFKDCCPSARDTEYHLRGWHLPSEGLPLEPTGVVCEMCHCEHTTKHCPLLHPGNRAKRVEKFRGPLCAHCGLKGHLGIDCPERPQRENQFLSYDLGKS